MPTRYEHSDYQSQATPEARLAKARLFADELRDEIGADTSGQAGSVSRGTQMQMLERVEAYISEKEALLGDDGGAPVAVGFGGVGRRGGRR